MVRITDYKVIFDTNVLYTRKGPLKELFNLTLVKFVEFLKKNNIDNLTISLPKIVFEERIKQRSDDISDSLEVVGREIKRLKPLNRRIDCTLSSVQECEKALRRKTTKFIRDNQIEILPDAKITMGEIKDRALKKIKPFKSADNGFKDTLIWLALLNNAKLNKSTKYILCSDDGVFENHEIFEEFKKVHGGKIEVFKTIQEVEVYLDGQLNLELELKKIHNKIKRKVEEKIGFIMTELNRKSYVQRSYVSQESLKVIGFDFKGIVFNSIYTATPYGEDKYTVTLTLKTLAHLSKGDKKQKPHWSSALDSIGRSFRVGEVAEVGVPVDSTLLTPTFSHYTDFEKIINVAMTLMFDESTKEIEMLSITTPYEFDEV